MPRKFFRKRRTRKPAQAKTIRKIVKQVVLSNIEEKFHDNGLVNSNLDYNGQILDVSAIALGDTAQTRTGQLIRPQYFEFKFKIYSGSALSGYMFRVIIFKWNSNTATTGAPTPGDVLDQTGTANAILGKRNRDSLDQVHIVKDSGPSIPHNTSNGSAVISWRVPLRNYKLLYNDGAVTTGSDKLYVLVISDAVGMVLEPVYGYESRLMFRDA